MPAGSPMGLILPACLERDGGPRASLCAPQLWISTGGLIYDEARLDGRTSGPVDNLCTAAAPRFTIENTRIVIFEKAKPGRVT